MAIGFVMVPFLTTHLRLDVYFGLILIVSASVVAMYMHSRRLVWVSLDERGMSARGMTGRPVSIHWAEDAEVTPVRKSGMRGVDVRRSSDAGLIRSSILSMFIPEGILVSAEFAEALRDLAPIAHPLRRHAVAN